jgi:hypothetical protein
MSRVLIVAAAAALIGVDAVDVAFKNQCGYPIDVYDNHGTCTLQPGSGANPVYGCWRGLPGGATMYRNGAHDQATRTFLQSPALGS